MSSDSGSRRGGFRQRPGMELALFIFELGVIAAVITVIALVLTGDSALPVKVPLVLLLAFVVRAFVKNLVGAPSRRPK